MKCEDSNIPVNHYAIPPKLAQAQEAAQKKLQMTLDDTLVPHKEVFTQKVVLHAVAQFIACNDQVSMMQSQKTVQYLLVTVLLQAFAVANNKLIKNSHVSMWPKTKTSDIPSTHNVSIYIHNGCMKWLKQTQEDITVSTTAHGWVTKITNQVSESGCSWFGINDFGCVMASPSIRSECKSASPYE